MTIWNTPLTEDSEAYLCGMSQRSNIDIDFVFQSAFSFDEPHIQISKLQANFLQFLTDSFGPKNVLEIGTFVGYSFLAMAKIMPKRTKIISVENSPKFYELASENKRRYEQLNGQLASKAELVLGDAKEYLSKLTEIPDFIFLDGDKLNYGHYFDWALKHLKPGGVFIVDNILFKNSVIGATNSIAASIKDMTESVKKSDAFHYSLLPVGDGMLVSRKKPEKG
jgi:predicted O-methyltransferase YrrM